MNRQPFTSSALKRNLSESEKNYYFSKSNSEELELLINDAVLIADENFRSGVSVKKLNIKGRCVYSSSNLKEKLILRHCNSNLKCLESLLPKQRNKIIDELKIYLKEGTKFKVYRLDIKSFFESIQLPQLFKYMHNESRLSRHTKNLLEWYLKACENIHETQGLPRGLEISPMLSELYLAEFDYNINRHAEVFYYSRFVDDMVIVSSGNEDQASFMKQVETFLPNGLKLNKNKLNISPLIPKRSKGENNNNKILHKFDFLGYSFSIIDTPLLKKEANSRYRSVVVDLSNSRLKKIKTRISRSFYAFKNDGDYKLLLDRISFLTSNRDLNRKIKSFSSIEKRKISTGIYYSNAKLDENSKALEQLDNFLIYCAMSNKGRLSNVSKYSLRVNQRKELLRNNFTKGFSERVYRKYNFQRYTEITKIWL
ncbi:antiviral reverse transcriptase Drt3a [Yersinia enterocolitica]|uniref:antiviral reverse transcriptase Drt3a n=1 Tax=Yersinia enterocolitica TaxID=630 RepID=UPI001C8EECA0|nr:antiviral reverse transcriptase Drt3a [Yersinia enterocolitica]MBX9489371.1 RNA-directed DNA polymerase [Yersinia enterocolitica]MBX9494316.1 RNA-directed DNA polymerase [Yersinia enterocolitica]